MATKTPYFVPSPTGKPVTKSQVDFLSGAKTTIPYFVPSPTGLPVTPSQASFLSGSRGSSPTPFYPTPTGAPIPQAPITISSGGGSSGSQVLGAYTSNLPSTITGNMLSSSSQGSVGLPNYANYSPTTMSSSPGGVSSFDMSSLLTPELVAKGVTLKDGQFVFNPDQLAKDNPQETQANLIDKLTASFKKLMPQRDEKQKQNLYQQMYGITPEQARIEADNAKNLVNSLTSQLNSIQATKNANLLQLRGIGSQEGVTEAVYGGQQAVIEREATIKSLPLAAQLSTAQANYEVAQKHIDQYFQMVSEDQDSQYKYQMDLFTSVFNYADKLEQRQITEMANQKTSNQNTLTDARNNAQQWASYAKDGGNSSAVGTLLGITYPSISDPQFQTKMDKINQTISSVATGIQPKATEGEKDQSAIISINSQLTSKVGEDGYTDPNLYSRLRATSSLSATDFDNRFGYLVNPQSRANLGITSAVAGSQWKPPSADEATVNSLIATHPEVKNIDQDKLKMDATYFYWVKSELEKL